jgi:hydroxyethylthiazole kinase-like sugar kinase family protein
VQKKEGRPQKKQISGTLAAACKREQCIVMSGHVDTMRDGRWEIAGQNERKKYRSIIY